MSFVPRLPFRVVVAWLVLAGLFGWWVSFGMTTPENRYYPQLARAILELHVLTSGCALGTMLIALVSTTRELRTPALAAVVGVAAVIPLALVMDSPVPGGMRSGMLVGVALVVALFGFLAAHARWLGRGLTPTVLAWSLLALGETIAALGTWPFSGPSALMPAVFELLLVAAVATLAEPADDQPTRPLLLVAVTALAVSSYRGLVPELRDAGNALHVVAGAVALYYAVRGLRSRWPARLARWTARLAVLLFVEALLLRGFLGLVSVDVHLYDTTFTTGTLHVGALGLVLTVLALWLRDRQPRRWFGPVATIGLLFISAGAHIFCWSSLRLGARGMPRGYWKYVAEFQSLHWWVWAGSTVLLIGLVLLAVAVRRVSPQVQVDGVFD